MVLTRDAVEADEAADVVSVKLEEGLRVTVGFRAKSRRLGTDKQADLVHLGSAGVDKSSSDLGRLPTQCNFSAQEILFDRLWTHISHRNRTCVASCSHSESK